MPAHKIGVFDSGVGGQSVVAAIRRKLPELEVIYKDDKQHLPYGDKSAAELLELTTPIFEAFVQEGCAVVVVACNTVTTTIIGELRNRIKVPLIGIEPMVKPAASLTSSNKIAVCATPATLRSERYQLLKATYAKSIEVLEPDCSDWAFMIENDALNNQKIESRVREVCEKGADVIVLACTHYHWIEREIQDIADEYQARVLQPEDAVVTQLQRVLEQLP